MPESKFRLEKSGSVGRAKTEPAESILATGHIREGYARVWIAGGLLGLLSIAYIVALWQKVEGAQSILVVISSGIGFLLGRDSRTTRHKD